MSVSARSIFISYSHQDTEFVDRLRADLEASGFTTWLDKTGLKPGTDDWDEELRRALRDSKALVLVASPSSRRAKVVKDELRIADMYRLVVIPVWAEGVEWMDSIPVGRGGMQYCDARGDKYKGAMKQLVATLRSERPEILVDPPEDPPKVEPNTGPTAVDVGSDARTPPPSPVAEPRNPYKGLAAFTSADSRDFFGRDKLVTELVGDIQTVLRADSGGMSPERLVVVLGPSGSGKSSVVMAGLLPNLQKGALPGSERWVYLDPLVPGVHPIEALATTLCRKMPQRTLQSLLEDLGDDDARGLHLLASGISRDPGALVVVMIDQFEELFNLTSDESERQQFIDLLVNAVTEPRGPVLLLLTLRADFYDRPMQYPALYQALQHHQRSVLPMELDDLRAVIEKPAQLPDVQVTFEGPLVGDLLFDIYKEVGGLPLLEFTLDQLFRKRTGHALTQEAYREIGGVRGALTKHAEETYDGLPSEEHRQMARVLFLRLIDPGETEQDTTRRRTTLQELTLSDAHRSEVLREVTNSFVNARLLVEDKQDEKVTVEVAHEALIRVWPRLADWLREGRDDVRLQQRISETADEWVKAKLEERKQALLYRGAVLTEAQTWLERGEPSADELAFVQASTKSSEQEKQEATEARERVQAMRRRNRTLGLGLIGTVALLLVIIVITSLAYEQSQLQAKLNSKNSLLSGTYIVVNTNDSGAGSLRQEIAMAAPGSAIVFKKGLQGTIVLQSALTITKNLVIDGPGVKKLTISGDGKYTVIDISDNVAVTISGLNITNGYTELDGGGIYVGDASLDTSTNIVFSVVTLISVDVTSSHAVLGGGGIMNQGNLSIFDSTIQSNSAPSGGGIYVGNDGYTVLNDTNVLFNQAQDFGGGIYNDEHGYFYLNTSDISNNTAMRDGGGVYTASGGTASCGGVSSKFASNSPDNYNANPSCQQPKP
jgi:hypothetical protein